MAVATTSSRPLDAPAETSILVVDDVIKRFDTPEGAITAVDHVSFAVRPGEFLSVIGPSGCGKSTLFSMIGGLTESYDGTISVSGANALGLTAGGSFRPGGVFTVTAYVKGPQQGQQVKLALPDGLSLAEGEGAEKQVEAGGDYSQVSWRVRAGRLGDYTVRATSGTHEARTKVRIKNSGIFDTR